MLTAEGIAKTICRRLASLACVRTCERVRCAWKRQHSLVSRAPRRGVARAAATRESVSSAKWWSSGGWPPLAWIPWRVVHLRVKVLARGTYARTYACRSSARARLVSPRKSSFTRIRIDRVHVALQIATREMWTSTGTHARTHARTVQRPRSVARVHHTSMLCVYNRGHSCFAVLIFILQKNILDLLFGNVN